MKEVPVWITELEADELQFIKRFVLASGSLKEMADIYGVTYPTVRNRLNIIIGKMKLSEESREDAYVSLIKRMVMEGKVDFEAAAVLIREYREQKKGDEYGNCNNRSGAGSADCISKDSCPENG